MSPGKGVFKPALKSDGITVTSVCHWQKGHCVKHDCKLASSIVHLPRFSRVKPRPVPPGSLLRPPQPQVPILKFSSFSSRYSLSRDILCTYCLSFFYVLCCPLKGYLPLPQATQAPVCNCLPQDIWNPRGLHFYIFQDIKLARRNSEINYEHETRKHVCTKLAQIHGSCILSHRRNKMCTPSRKAKK